MRRTGWVMITLVKYVDARRPKDPLKRADPPDVTAGQSIVDQDDEKPE